MKTWACGATGLLLSLMPAERIAAQALDVTAYGLAATSSEVDRTRQAKGLGIGVELGVELGRFRWEVQGETASLDADYSLQGDYAVRELSVLALYRWRPSFALQLGAGRRFTSPDFVAQDVGAIRVGLRTETRLSSFGRIEASASYLPVTRFSGGGSAGLAFEIGFGVAIGPANGRFAGIVKYGYQRLRREVNAVAVPIQFSAARVGVRARL